jgi:hypothetical protein
MFFLILITSIWRHDINSLVYVVGRPNSFYAPFGCVQGANCISWIRLCQSSGSCKIPCHQPHSSSLLLFTVLSPLWSTSFSANGYLRSRTDEEDTLQSHLARFQWSPNADAELRCASESGCFVQQLTHLGTQKLGRGDCAHKNSLAHAYVGVFSLLVLHRGPHAGVLSHPSSQATRNSLR